MSIYTLPHAVILHESINKITIEPTILRIIITSLMFLFFYLYLNRFIAVPMNGILSPTRSCCHQAIPVTEGKGSPS